MKNMNHKKISLVLLIALLAIVSLAACQNETHAGKWTCPMHPQIVRDEPGTCPICGMNLVPLNLGEKTTQETGSEVTIDPHAVQNLGVKYVTIQKKEIQEELLVSGRVVHDHQLWVSQNEYLETLKLGDKNLVSAAEGRLRLLGLSKEWIQELKINKKSDMSFHLPGLHQPIFFEAFIPQNEILKLKVNQKARVLDSMGSPLAQGKVKSISTVKDPETQNIRVLIESDRPIDLPLNSFVQVGISISLGEHIAIPEEAVILTGLNQYAYVAKGEGKFERRALTLGKRGGENFVVIKGLTAGETVVSSGHFLIDAETTRVLGSMPEQNIQHEKNHD